MKPRIYNRQELVTREAAAIRNGMVDIINSSILFWYSRQQSHIVTGDVHGRQTAATILATLDTIKEQMQGVGPAQ